MASNDLNVSMEVATEEVMEEIVIEDDEQNLTIDEMPTIGIAQVQNLSMVNASLNQATTPVTIRPLASSSTVKNVHDKNNDSDDGSDQENSENAPEPVTGMKVDVNAERVLKANSSSGKKQVNFDSSWNSQNALAYQLAKNLFMDKKALSNSNILNYTDDAQDLFAQNSPNAQETLQGLEWKLKKEKARNQVLKLQDQLNGITDEHAKLKDNYDQAKLKLFGFESTSKTQAERFAKLEKELRDSNTNRMLVEKLKEAAENAAKEASEKLRETVSENALNHKRKAQFQLQQQAQQNAKLQQEKDMELHQLRADLAASERDLASSRAEVERYSSLSRNASAAPPASAGIAQGSKFLFDDDRSGSALGGPMNALTVEPVTPSQPSLKRGRNQATKVALDVTNKVVMQARNTLAQYGLDTSKLKTWEANMIVDTSVSHQTAKTKLRELLGVDLDSYVLAMTEISPSLGLIAPESLTAQKSAGAQEPMIQTAARTTSGSATVQGAVVANTAYIGGMLVQTHLVKYQQEPRRVVEVAPGMLGIATFPMTTKEGQKITVALLADLLALEKSRDQEAQMGMPAPPTLAPAPTFQQAQSGKQPLKQFAPFATNVAQNTGMTPSKSFYSNNAQSVPNAMCHPFAQNAPFNAQNASFNAQNATFSAQGNSYNAQANHCFAAPFPAFNGGGVAYMAPLGLANLAVPGGVKEYQQNQDFSIWEPRTVRFLKANGAETDAKLIDSMKDWLGEKLGDVYDKVVAEVTSTCAKLTVPRLPTYEEVRVELYKIFKSSVKAKAKPVRFWNQRQVPGLTCMDYFTQVKLSAWSELEGNKEQKEAAVLQCFVSSVENEDFKTELRRHAPDDLADLLERCRIQDEIVKEAPECGAKKNSVNTKINSFDNICSDTGSTEIMKKFSEVSQTMAALTEETKKLRAQNDTLAKAQVAAMQHQSRRPRSRSNSRSSNEQGNQWPKQSVAQVSQAQSSQSQAARAQPSYAQSAQAQPSASSAPINAQVANAPAAPVVPHGGSGCHDCGAGGPTSYEPFHNANWGYCSQRKCHKCGVVGRMGTCQCKCIHGNRGAFGGTVQGKVVPSCYFCKAFLDDMKKQIDDNRSKGFHPN
jgi:hypothetical protein